MTTEITQLIFELKEKIAVLLVAENKAIRLIAGRKAVITKTYGRYKTLKPTNTYAMALAEAETLLNNLTNERRAFSELLFQLQYQLYIATRQDWTFVTPAPVAETVEVAAPVAQDGFSLATEALLDTPSISNVPFGPFVKMTDGKMANVREFHCVIKDAIDRQAKCSAIVSGWTAQHCAVVAASTQGWVVVEGFESDDVLIVHRRLPELGFGFLIDTDGFLRLARPNGEDISDTYGRWC